MRCYSVSSVCVCVVQLGSRTLGLIAAINFTVLLAFPMHSNDFHVNELSVMTCGTMSFGTVHAHMAVNFGQKIYNFIRIF